MEASDITTPMCSRSLATTIFVAEPKIGWITAAAAASRCSSRAADKPTLAAVPAVQVPVAAASRSLAAETGPAQASGPAEVAAESRSLAGVNQVEVNGRVQVRGLLVNQAVAMRLGTFHQAT